MVGQPEIAVHKESPDPATGTVEASAGEVKLSCFMVDTGHASPNFYARRMHFPGADGARQIKVLRRTLGRSLNGDEWERRRSSLPTAAR